MLFTHVDGESVRCVYVDVACIAYDKALVYSQKSNRRLLAASGWRRTGLGGEKTEFFCFMLWFMKCSSVNECDVWRSTKTFTCGILLFMIPFLLNVCFSSFAYSMLLSLIYCDVAARHFLAECAVRAQCLMHLVLSSFHCAAC